MYKVCVCILIIINRPSWKLGCRWTACRQPINLYETCSPIIRASDWQRKVERGGGAEEGVRERGKERERGRGGGGGGEEKEGEEG